MSKMNILKVIDFLLFLSVVKKTSMKEDKLSLLREKAKAYYKTKYGKDSSENFLGYDSTEYPGGNAELKKIQKTKWDEYYRCLKDQNDNFGPHGSATPEAMLGFEGLSVKFECKVCISPLEKKQKDVVEWFWAPRTEVKLEPVEFTEHILLSPEDKSLTIYNLQKDNEGQYVCFLGKTGMPPFFLTVINSSLNVAQVHPNSAKHGPYPKPPEHVPQHKIYLTTEWGQWSPCSKCGKVGKRFKTGYCTITSADYYSENDSSLKNVMELKKNANEYKLFDIFKWGIPCQSYILPQEIKDLDSVKNRKNEIMLGFCKKPCNKDVVFELRDNQGRVIETANNSAGIYSMVQGLPPVQPDVERKLIYANKEESITLSCPGNLNSDTPVQWQIKGKLLIPEIISKESNQRITISIMDKIIINNIHLTDTNIYSCWQNDELAGTIRLVVENKIKLNFNHHVMLVGITGIVLTFLYVYLKAFLGRKYAKIN